MMRSMFSGVSGLRAHQSRMDVIGNNISNVNTVGFKSSRVTFQEIYSQTLRGAGAPDNTTGRGGMNPMQVGLGITVASVDSQFTRGSFQTTDNPFDLAIDGDGFFITKGGNDSAYKFTRAGNFGLDEYGNLTTANGDRVMGWQERVPGSTTDFDTEKELSAINLYTDDYNGNKKVLAARQTEKAEFGGNLDASMAVVGDPAATPATIFSGVANLYDDIKTLTAGKETFKAPYVFYDSLGNDYTVTLTFVKNQVIAPTAPATEPETEWFVYGVEEQTQLGYDNYYKNHATPPPTTLYEPEVDPTTAATGTPFQAYIKFNAKGEPISVDPASGTNTDNLLSADMVIAEPKEGAASFQMNLDFKNLTMFKTDNSVKATDVDGYAPGKFVTASVGPNGIITAIYSNGQQQSVGQVGLAWFENPAGLQRVGNNQFMVSANSGDFTKAVRVGTDGTGNLLAGTLEMSNVDLSKEFTDMITTQRGFQANSRIITTSDEMLQELVNLKR